MNKHLLKVKAMLDTRKKNIAEKLASASISEDQKTKLDAVLAQVDEALGALDAAEEEATADQITAIFTQAIESFTASNEVETEEMSAKIEARLNEMQAKITSNAGPVAKFKAHMSISKMNAAGAKSDYKSFSAGVDVDAWTPEAEIETVETFHPLIGVTGGFEISSTSKESIKVRKLSKDSGGASVVLNHAAKPVIEQIGAQSIVNVSTFAGVVEGVADEDLEDNAGLEAEIQQEALTDLGEYENTAAIALLEAQAQAFANTNFGTKVGADTRTAVAAIIDQVRQALGKRESSINFALNSSQWALLEDLRASTSGVLLGIDSILGNVNKIVDNSLATDSFYCWAQKFTKLKIYVATQAEWYKGIKVVGNESAVTSVYSEWRTDESSLRVRQRQAMYTTDATTIVKGTLSGVVESVTYEEN